MNFQIVFGGEGEYCAQRGELGDGSESLIEIDTFNLCEALGDESSLVLLDSPVWASFDMKDPLATDDLSTFGPRDDIIDVELLLSSHFVFTGCEPLDGIRAGHCFVVSLWLGSLGVGEVGAGTVGRNIVSWIVVRDGGTNCTLGTRIR